MRTYLVYTKGNSSATIIMALDVLCSDEEHFIIFVAKDDQVVGIFARDVVEKIILQEK